MAALGAAPEFQEYLKVDEQKEQARRVILESKVRDMLLRYSEHYEDYLNIVTASEKRALSFK